jgi:hypothetical protein
LKARDTRGGMPKYLSRKGREDQSAKEQRREPVSF